MYGPSQKLFKLIPSDFKYLWEDCKHCYYRKVISGITLPSIGIPGIFMKMNSMLQQSLQNTNPHDLNPDIPHGKFVLQEGFLKSKPIPFNNKSYISGRFDLMVEFEDGSHGVIDVKITDAKDGDLDKFDRQLHAYKFALENSLGSNYKQSNNVSKLGLLIASPESIAVSEGKVIFHSKPIYKEIKIDMNNFFRFIQEVEELLSESIPPLSSECA